MTRDEYVVVQTQAGCNATEIWFDSWELSRHSTLSAAKRSGLRELGHDDFNIAVVRDGRMVRWTWMGEDTEGPTTYDEMVAISERLGWPTPDPLLAMTPSDAEPSDDGRAGSEQPPRSS
jgi:hypothetical protein